MAIGTISDAEAGLDIRTKLNLAIGQLNANTGEVDPETVATYDIVAAEAGFWKFLDDAAGVAVNVPLEATESIPVGAIYLFTQVDVGQLTFTPEGGVTINFPATLSLVSKEQWSTIGIKKTDTNEWLAFGHLEEAP
jgi:hypothetical protein